MRGFGPVFFCASPYPRHAGVGFSMQAATDEERGSWHGAYHSVVHCMHCTRRVIREKEPLTF